MIFIGDLDKVKVLQALYAGALVQSESAACVASFRVSGDKYALTYAEANDYFLQYKGHFEHINGKIIKVDLSSEAFDPRMYNCGNGSGCAERVILELRHNSSLIQESQQPKGLWQRAFSIFRNRNCKLVGVSSAPVAPDDTALDHGLLLSPKMH